ncbi:cysteine-rich receptor-like protein kinase 2 isoform X2 [Ananas comosus]|uniref:Cysteine-rich receptor-like protein kinase 2 n=1 Tax=Ananas comosus TaxID=4615 RepID=A0A199VKF7_ANACO|nr:cysteine-rich receptor-like protein kinase 2 isoform X2 [Ananas comosus]OAY77361.1 Cysteine-rich receptor-like protein kinase 2 [Ananas comosus]
MKPSHSSSSTHLHLLILFLVLVLFVAAAAGDTTPTIFDTICGRNQTQDPEAFDVNFVTTMEMIFQNITESGFGAAVSGGANTVYGLGQCFGYLAPTSCQICYFQSRLKLPHCLPATDSRIYLDGCFLRYADHNVSADATDAYDTSVCGNASTNSSAFNDAATRLVANLTAGALNQTKFYQVGSASVAAGVSVYGMAQCWRSLNASGCRECLESARASAVKCLPATDGKALNAGCFVRYSTEPFYLAASSSGGGSSARRTIIVALTSVVAVLAVIGIIIIWKKMRSKDDLIDDLDGSGEYIRSISGSHLSFKYEDLRKATDNFNQINKLGQGGYGSVYKGVLSDGREIAVKRLFFTTRPWVDQFFNEVTLVSQVQHKNLVKLLGCSVEGPESLLVYEYLCNTSLDNFLFDSFKKNLLDWERRFEIIVGTAEGLSYLHSASEIRIIHRDIKASNILLDERFKPKIADFGLARNFMEDQSHLSTGLAGTFGYMAPEYIVHGQLTEKADIYSYGVLVLEIITGRKNHNSVASSDEGHSLMSLIWQHFNAKTVIELLDPCLQKRCPEEQALKVFQVGLLCAQASPNLRPPMWKVVELLNSESKELPLPSQPPFINVKGTSSKSNSSESPSVVTSSSKSPFSLNQISVSQLDASSSNVNSQ